MSRWQAAGIHLLLSIGVFAAFWALTRWVWYPGFLFELMGAGGLLVLLTSVDVGLGPLCTLAVFKTGKKGLKFDLSIIAAFQLAALAYGAWVTFMARPVYLVFSGARYEVITENEVVNREGAVEPWLRSSWFGPEYAYAEPPSGKEATDLMFSAGFGGADVYNYPKYYRPLSDNLEKIGPQTDLPKDVIAQGGEAAERAQLLLARAPQAPSDVRIAALKSGMKRNDALIDPKTGEILAFVAIDL